MDDLAGVRDLESRVTIPEGTDHTGRDGHGLLCALVARLTGHIDPFAGGQPAGDYQLLIAKLLGDLDSGRIDRDGNQILGTLGRYRHRHQHAFQRRIFGIKNPDEPVGPGDREFSLVWMPTERIDGRVE